MMMDCCSSGSVTPEQASAQRELDALPNGLLTVKRVGEQEVERG